MYIHKGAFKYRRSKEIYYQDWIFHVHISPALPKAVNNKDIQ